MEIRIAALIDHLRTGGAILTNSRRIKLPPFFTYRQTYTHVLIVAVTRQKIFRCSVEYANRKWLPMFPELDLMVNHICNAFLGGISEDTAIAQCPWPKFHSPPKPCNDLSITE